MKKTGLTISILLSGLMFFSLGLRAQTLVTQPISTTPAPGAYYSPTSITLLPGFSFTATATSTLKLYISAPDCIPLTTAPSISKNYIMTSVPRIPGYNPSSTNYSACDVMQTIEYMDGLGRPMQTVQVKGSPADNDLVQPVAYDANGRQSIKYLPYVAASADGSYKSDAINTGAGVFNYYYPAGSSASSGAQQNNGIVYNPVPYAVTNFELSPLNRAIEQGAPGTPWQPVSGLAGHTIRMAYLSNNVTALTDTTNTTLVALYTATINGDQSRTLARAVATAGNYAAGKLYITVSRNENLPATGRGGTVEEYKDIEGHVILKRTFIYSGSPATLQMLSTYYVYDEAGNLCFVLPPGSGADSALPSPIIQSNLCYQYQYDQRNRLVQKKIPGKDWEYLLYNNLNQVVATQDGNQRAVSPQQFTFTKYDGEGRVILTGVYLYTSAAGINNRVSLQGTISGVSTLWETPVTTGNGYTSAAWPITWTGATLSVSYYDNYAIPGLPSQYTAPTGNSTQTAGLLTASQTNILGTANMLWDVHYYDELERVLQAYQHHNQGGGATLNAANYDVVANTYDFTNAILTTNRKHYNVAISTTAPAVTIANTYNYDHLGRKTQTFEQINSGTNVLLAQNDYNELGQLKGKDLHSVTGGSPFMQNITYSYNERGWLLSDNAALFSEQLQYNTGNNKQYNGNIAYQLYQSATTPATTSYTYSYDQLNRLTAGTSNDNYNETAITYDLQSNITALQRTYGTTTAIDNLNYTYTNGGNYTNQVQSISDIAPDVITGKGYKFSNGGSFAYTYDANGNMQTDASKGITNINYNLLNLPATYTMATGTSSFTYDATGNKIRKVIVSGSMTTTNDYIGGIQYYNGAISFIQTEEGRALWNGSTYTYNYNLADHLGNTRLTFDTHTATVTPVQQDDYFPFGMEINRSVTGAKNEYLYNKKELQEDIGLSDFGGRYYDAVIGSWTTIDPLSELDRRLSPYNYTQDNPVGRIDPDGMYDQSLVDQWKVESLASMGYNGTQISGALNQSQQDTPKKKGEASKTDSYGDYVKKKLVNAPRLKPLTHWWQKLLALGGRIYDNVEYDSDGNPVRVVPTMLTFPMYISGPGDLEFISEKIAGYFVRSTVVVEGGIYTRTVSILGNGKNEGKGIFALIKAFEADADAKGATTIVLKGTTVMNAKLMNPAIAAKLGYAYKQVNYEVFELTKVLTK